MRSNIPTRQPKAGWTLEKIRGAYAKSYDYYGTPTSEGVKEIVWSGGNLGDDEYDEFVLRVYLTKDRFTRPEDFRAMEPRLPAFAALREKWDPRRRLRSAQSRRLFGDKA